MIVLSRKDIAVRQIDINCRTLVFQNRSSVFRKFERESRLVAGGYFQRQVLGILHGGGSLLLNPHLCVCFPDTDGIHCWLFDIFVLRSVTDYPRNKNGRVNFWLCADCSSVSYMTKKDAGV